MTYDKSGLDFEHKIEVIKTMEPFVGEHIGSLLKPINESWQPQDFLPDLTKENWREQLVEFRQCAINLPDEVLVVLVGDMVTEEALPSYQAWLNRLEGVHDTSGTDNTGWARWTRGWAAEENRHGDLLNKYLYLTGRVDMRSVEETVHHLINNGFNPHTERDPYMGFIYTSFQERATKISHRNVGVLAKKSGEDRLHKICGLIAGDEARHEKAYKLFVKKIFELDPVGALIAFGNIMKAKIAMPALLMYDGKDSSLFTKFSAVAQALGVYTAADYAEIIRVLVEEWKVETITGLSDRAARAQDYVCGLADRYAKLADRVNISGTEKFTWIYDREITLSLAPSPA